MSASASLGPLSGSFTLGPLYQHTWDFHDWKLATVYDNTFSIASQTETLPSFTIGDTFHPDLTVTTTTDGNTQGTLRYAVNSANVLGANSSAPEVIHLGPGTYNLTLAPSGTDDGTSGDLDVTGENVIIQGAGAGQTIINAAGLGDRIFDVNSGAGLTLEGVTLENGGLPTSGTFSSTVGGAVYNSGTLNIDNSLLKNNSAKGGGAIYNSGTLRITNSELDDNNATDVGGAIYNSGTGPVTILDSTLSHNSALNGGGIYSSALTQLTILNSTIYGNTASGQGGGLDLNDPSPTTLINDTIAGNVANYSGNLTGTSNGGGIYLFGAGVNTFLGNTIVVGNVDNPLVAPTPDNIAGNVVDSTSSNNLIGTGGSGGLTNGTNGNLVGDNNAGLGTFDYHGGPTKTVQLHSGSLAIDKGSNALAAQYGLTTDQRGYSRIVNGTVDIGAVEYQYDLSLSGYIELGSPADPVQQFEYVYTVTNNGPDPVTGAKLTAMLPQGIVYLGYGTPLTSDWIETDPGIGTNGGTVTFTDTGDLNSGDSFEFIIKARVQNIAAGTSLTNPATEGSTAWDTNPQNNSATLTVTNEQEGQTFDQVKLYHFTDPNLPDVPLAVVNAPSVSSSGGSLATGTYYYTVTSTTATGETMPSSEVSATTTGSTSAVTLSWNQVAGATGYKIYRGTTPGAEHTLIATITSGSTPTFTDDGTATTSSATPPTPKIFTASVGWGDSSSNTSRDGSGTVAVVADPNGGFDVLGSHAYAEEGYYSDTVSVAGPDGTALSSSLQQLFIAADSALTAGALTPPPNATINQPITKALLFHFTDANPNATASDYTAIVNWGDGTTNSSSDNSGNVYMVANSSGGFDVYGSHTYTQIVNPGTFSVEVNDEGGSSTSASDSNFQVLNPDLPLTAGTLNVPSVTTEGQSISNQLLFQFTDPDSNAQASDFLAFVSWGDATFNNSNDGSNSVQVQQISTNSDGSIVFGVYGSHSFSEGSAYFAVKVADLGDPRSSTPDTGGQFTGAASSAPLTIIDPPVTVAASTTTFSASEGSMSTVQTLATFTDPGGEESDANAYIAIIQWGDGSVTAANLKAQAYYAQATVNSQGQITGQVVSASNVRGIVLGGDGQTFAVNLAHQYAEDGSYTITITLIHDGILSQPVTITATVTDPAVMVKAPDNGFTATEGVTSSVQTVATFTDPGGAEYFVPSLFTPTVASSGGSLAAGTYYYTVTSTTAYGESTASNEVSATTTGSTSIVKLGWGPVSNATGYKIYRGTSPGAEDTLIATINNGSIFGFWDNGSETTSSASPPTDTSADYPSADPNPYTATIDWGDNTTSTATLANGGIVLGSDGQTFSVNLAHQYADEGQYTITTTVNHNGQLSQVTGTADVADNDNLTATGGVPLTGTYGTADFSGVTVATFTDTYTGTTASDFAATIDWGDGQTSPGTVSGSNGNFSVMGSHSYANAGSYNISVTISDDGAGTATATASTTAAISRLAVTLSGSGTYDGTNTADASILSITNLVSGDDITLSGSATLASANAGPETITDFSGLTLQGTAASNYTLTGASGTVTINPLAVTLSGSRTYDGTNTAAASILTITNVVSGDTVSLSPTGYATLASANAGTQTITDFTKLTLGGASAGNYTLTGASGSVTITPATLSVTPVTITPTAGAPISTTIATINNNVDPNNGNDYTVTIDWGDGTPITSGTITGTGTPLTVTGSHTYSTPNTYTVTITITNNQGNTTPVTINETITVASLNQGVSSGLTATIGFWNNQNGQALIDSFNGGPNSTALANWLATTFPNLYGNLAGDSNLQVAAYFQTLFNQSSGPKAQAQTLAVALNVYATTSSLGGTAGAAYGFTVSAAGLGAYSFNVGSDGAAFGVANNITLNVYQLLLAVNNKAVKGVLYNGSEVADLFGNLNQSGDIG